MDEPVKVDRRTKWRLANSEQYHELQRKYAQRYYYENREKILAKKQAKHAASTGTVIIEVVPAVPVVVPTVPVVVPEVVPEPDVHVKWIHPFFSK